jgi:hypothetical protein
MAVKALSSLVILSCLLVGACGPSAEDIARAEAQEEAQEAAVQAQATPSPIPSCDEAKASEQSRKDATIALNKETDKLDWQSKNLETESIKLVSDHQGGRITEEEYKPKAADITARAKAIKDRVAAAQALQQCLKSENPT